ncbi:hypothetical protein JCM33374_g5673 [Metschnikowia sp. JCM 33374]|nr:hypothetical protein JCM33374_g5673 [Metschnikowia sp. JCM 33374]
MLLFSARDGLGLARIFWGHWKKSKPGLGPANGPSQVRWSQFAQISTGCEVLRKAHELFEFMIDFSQIESNLSINPVRKILGDLSKNVGQYPTIGIFLIISDAARSDSARPPADAATQIWTQLWACASSVSASASVTTLALRWTKPEPLLPPPKRFKPPAETNVNYEVVNDSEVIDASSNAQGTGSDKDTDLVDLSNAKHSSIDSPSSTKDIDDYEEDLEISRVGLGAKKPVSSYNQKASLNESIINENSIGFKIMQKMGYTQGKAIGSSQNENALIEPLSIRAKPTRAGIGVVEFKPKAATDIPSESTSTFQEYLKTKHAQQNNQIIITKLKKFCLAETGEDIRFEQGSLMS